MQMKKDRDTLDSVGTKLPSESNRLVQELARFTRKQRITMLSQVYAIQLTDGCSVGCDFCGLDSKRGVHKIIPEDTASTVIQEIIAARKLRKFEGVEIPHNRHSNLVQLYDASDPLDHPAVFRLKQSAKNAQDDWCHNPTRFCIYTAIPKGREQFAIDNLDEINRISISHVNRDRLGSFFDRLNIKVMGWIRKEFSESGDHEFLELGEIQRKGLDPDRLPFVDAREAMTSDIPIYLFCLDHLMPKNALTKLHLHWIMNAVLDLDFVTLLSEHSQEYGIHNSGRGYNGTPSVMSIQCINGVLLRPDGIFNVSRVPISEEVPTGRQLERIDPSDFKVATYNVGHVHYFDGDGWIYE
ncbi:hypothetical protein KKF81_00735 [Candidatus Micrarchaeota archaeon]|nr:hypothetical protein [Candidatus Micrarchaeota archaeon]